MPSANVFCSTDVGSVLSAEDITLSASFFRKYFFLKHHERVKALKYRRSRIAAASCDVLLPDDKSANVVWNEAESMLRLVALEFSTSEIHLKNPYTIAAITTAAANEFSKLSNPFIQSLRVVVKKSLLGKMFNWPVRHVTVSDRFWFHGLHGTHRCERGADSEPVGASVTTVHMQKKIGCCRTLGISYVGDFYLYSTPVFSTKLAIIS